jgi:hypothetical protein
MKTDLERFNERYKKVAGGCWEWHKVYSGGYGYFRMVGKNMPVHRSAYLLYKGPISEKLVIDHLCRNRACVNPEHLEAVSNKENILRGVSPQAINARRTHCKRGHELAGDNLIVNESTLRINARKCRACHNSHLSEKENRNGVYKKNRKTYGKPKHEANTI